MSRWEGGGGGEIPKGGAQGGRDPQGFSPGGDEITGGAKSLGHRIPYENTQSYFVIFCQFVSHVTICRRFPFSRQIIVIMICVFSIPWITEGEAIK